MVYSGGPIKHREDWEAWFITAFRYIEGANRLIDPYYDVADYIAKHAVELAFKGLIESKLGDVPARFLGGGEGHSILNLWKYVIDNGWVTETDVPRVNVEQISYSDFSDPDTGTKVLNCITGMIAHEKYPSEGRPPHEYMDK